MTATLLDMATLGIIATVFAVAYTALIPRWSHQKTDLGSTAYSAFVLSALLWTVIVATWVNVWLGIVVWGYWMLLGHFMNPVIARTIWEQQHWNPKWGDWL